MVYISNNTNRRHYLFVLLMQFPFSELFLNLNTKDESERVGIDLIKKGLRSLKPFTVVGDPVRIQT